MDGQDLANGMANGLSNGMPGGMMPEMPASSGATSPVVNNGAPMPEMGTAVLPPAPAPQVDGAMMPEMGGGMQLGAVPVPVGVPEAQVMPEVAAQPETATSETTVPEVPVAQPETAMPEVAVPEAPTGVSTESVAPEVSAVQPETTTPEVAAPAVSVTPEMVVPEGNVASPEMPEAPVAAEMEAPVTPVMPVDQPGQIEPEMTAAEAQANLAEVNQMAPTPSMIESAHPVEQVKEKKKLDFGGLLKKGENSPAGNFLSGLFKKKESVPVTPAGNVSAPTSTAVSTSAPGLAPAPASANANTVADGKKAEKQSFSEWFKNASFSDLVKPRAPKNVSGITESFEINLVPSVKAEALAAIHMRNLILFVCIIIVGVLGGTVAILGSIHGAKSIQMSSQDGRLDAMSEKINSFDGLEEYLTVQEQLGGISTINENRQVLSRVFPFLAAMQPDAPDSVTISEMMINMETDTIKFNGQADAGVEPLIDYRVLEAFKKSTEQMTYDYGNYVDKEDNEIPTRCMVENGADGGTLRDKGGMYAYWMLTKDGCDVNWKSRAEDVATLEEEIRVEEVEKAEDEDEKEVGDTSDRLKEIYEQYDETITKNWYDEWLGKVNLTRYTDEKLSEQQIADREASWEEYYGKLSEEEKWVADKMVNENGVRKQDVYFEKVYRTPQFSEWSKENEDGESYMSLSGEISGIPHFESKCNVYSGTEMENDKVMWTTDNECMLLDGEMEVTGSSNGRDANGNLVLKFEASFTLNKEPMNFNNKHMIAIAPGGKNVTDSYVQIEGMFGKAADDCQSSDVVCTNNTQNINGGNKNE